MTKQHSPLNIDNSPLNIDKIKTIIQENKEFQEFGKKIAQVFEEWKTQTIQKLKELQKGFPPKKTFQELSESLLQHYEKHLHKLKATELIDKYAIYQHLMDYWEETMQDDFYEIASEGWEIGKELKTETQKGKKGMDGLQGTLIPTSLLLQEYFHEEKKALEEKESELEALHSEKETLLEEEDTAQTMHALSPQQESHLKSQIKKIKESLSQKIQQKYPTLTIEEIKTLVIEKKWMAELQKRIQSEWENISHQLTQRIKELAERYATPLTQIQKEVQESKTKVEQHLKAMGYVWK